MGFRVLGYMGVGLTFLRSRPSEKYWGCSSWARITLNPKP